ncbi:MAG TPA: class I SAM-dependent methyltransferase [Anaerolineales bacterium]|nr:class I SAM-dependent methyltransferase [Anaerolineales bacterium]
MQEKQKENKQAEKDFLFLNLRELPYFRGLLRAVEARFYQEIDLPRPILDLGSGDGQFATVAFDYALDVGVDPWWEPMKEAARRGSYRALIQANGSQMPFPDGFFQSAISNSVLEHIPDLDAVLAEMARVLKPGAPFAFCVPNHNFLSSLSISNFLDRIQLKPLGDAYRSFFNRIARHYHCDPPEVWENRLNQAGFSVEKWWHYYPPESLHVTEWGHYLGLPSLVAHKLTGKWILVPTRWNLFLTEGLVRKHYLQNPICDQGVCTFYIARRSFQN